MQSCFLTPSPRSLVLTASGDSQNFQRYPPPRPHELPGIFGQAYEPSKDEYWHLFRDFSIGGSASREESEAEESTD